MMTQLLVPMTYAEKLEQELIQVEKDRKALSNLLANTVYLSRYATISFSGHAGASEDWDKTIGEADGELLRQSLR